MFRLLGRDAQSEPLSELEIALFTRALEVHVEAEFEPHIEASRAEQ